MKFDISDYKKLSPKEIEEIRNTKYEEVIKKEKTNTAKKFDFIVITELLKKGLLKNNPLNETSI